MKVRVRTASLRVRCVALAVCLLTLSCSARATPPPQGPASDASSSDASLGVPAAVRSALLTREFDAALRAIDAAAREKPAQVDWWAYLRASTLHQAQRFDEAARAFEALEQREPASAWRSKARFARADALRELGRAADAERIYESEAQQLLSERRQEELAAIYFEFADRLSTPPAVGEPDAAKLDYERAFALYAKVLELDVGDGMRERAWIGQLACRKAEKRWLDVISVCNAYQARFDPSRKGNEHVGARVLHVALEDCRAEIEHGAFDQARRGLENLLADCGAARESTAWTRWRERAGAAELARLPEIEGEAQFMIARTYASEDTQRAPLAIAALQRFLERFPGHERALEASFAIAERLASLGRTREAVAAYEATLQRADPAGASAKSLEAAAALRRTALFRKATMLARAESFDAAVAVFQDYVARFPTGPEWTQAQQAIVDVEHSIGAVARRERQFERAREAWSAFLTRRPLDGRAAQTQFDLARLYVEEAETQKQAAARAQSAANRAELERLFRSAVEQYRNVRSKYGGTDIASLALVSIGALCEKELGDLPGAVQAYRECTFGASAPLAAARLAELTQPSLQIATERAWRSDEQARVKVWTRNVEKLTVELYALDIEAYFRKNLRPTGVEDLDLDLIAADAKFEHEFAGYAEHLPLEREIELPVKAPGVWVVAVSTERMRATTLVVSSDIDVLARHSAAEALVFAQDAKLGKPAQGVRVLIAGTSPEGQPAIVEAVTGADGTARCALETLSANAPISVLGMRAGHCATNLGAARAALGIDVLQPAGVVFTDRPAYRPGDTVEWRAILRAAEDGRFVCQPGQPIRVAVYDATDQLVAEERLALSEFGSAHGSVALDAGASLGVYTVVAAAPFEVTGSFRVDRYQAPRVRLRLEPVQSVYFRGETAEVLATAEYAWGEPLVGSALLVEADGRKHELVTDERGQARIALPTRDRPSAGTLVVDARLGDERAAARVAVYIATQEYEATLTTPESTVLAGSSFDVALRTLGPDGKGVPRSMKLSVARRESDGESWTDEVVEERDIATGADGSAHATLALVKGGHHWIRARATDRFGNPIEASAFVFVSGDDDEQRLRFVVATHHLKVGERASLQLVHRDDPALALVTIEAGRLLEHRVVQLERGINRIELAVDHAHVANFFAFAAVMRRGRLATDETRFEVARELRVAIEPSQELYAPNGKARLRVVVRDQLDRPVRAELSLAVVDEAIFDLCPDRTVELRELFRPLFHTDEFSTTSTSAFRYEGSTRGIAAAVLEELERQRNVALERERRSRALGLLDELGKLGAPATPGPARTGADDFFLGADAEEKDKVANEVAGVAGGAGGGLGGRFGGKRSLKARGGSGTEVGNGEIAPDRGLAFFAPSVVTDARGEATVEFSLPEESTTWRVTARGCDTATLCGESKASFATRAEFFAELRAPLHLVAGDEPRIMARVHNQTGMTGKARLVLRATSGAAVQSLPLEVELAASSEVEVVFPALTAAVAGTLELALDVEGELVGAARAGTQAETISARPYRPRSTVRAELAVRAYGLEVVDSRSGTLTGEASFTLKLDAALECTSQRLELVFGPSVEALLVETALGHDSLRHTLLEAHATTAADLLGACALLEMLERGQSASASTRSALRSRAQALAAKLCSAQRSSGGWSFSGAAGNEHLETSALALVALDRARARGLELRAQVAAQAVAVLAKASRDASQRDDELKALLSWALAAHEAVDFGVLNRLHRQRATLSPAALAFTALALARAGNGPMAQEVADELEKRSAELDTVAKSRACSFAVDGNTLPHRSAVEMTALAVLALREAKPASGHVERAVEFLLARRPWTGLRARGLALAALASAHTPSPSTARAVRIHLRAGTVTRTLELDPTKSSQRVEIDVAGLDSVDVVLRLEGQGRPHFAASLRGFSAQFDTAETAKDAHAYLADAPRYAGTEQPTGFSILEGRPSVWSNRVSQLALGGITRARVSFALPDSQFGDSSDDVAVTIPLPAGADLVSGSVRPESAHVEVRAGEILMRLAQRSSRVEVRYELVGAVPGSYRALPATLWSAYEPERRITAAPTTLAVLPRGTASSDEYRATPDELYALGKAMCAAGDLEAGRAALTRLMDEFEAQLRDDPLARSAELLLSGAIERRAARDVVRFFEILREKNPDAFVELERVLAVGAAYRELEEFERATSIFRAALDETFGKELRVVGTLEEQREFDGALRTLSRLCSEYPDSPAVLDARMSLADKQLTLAKRAAREPSLSEKGHERVGMTLGAIFELQRFLALHRSDPRAPDAALNLVTAHLALDDYAGAAQLGGEFAQAFTEPRFADAFGYSRAVAEWYLGRDDSARAALQHIATVEYEAEDGSKTPSINRELALYILGQIHHARQEFTEAARYYERVREQFADARDTLASLRERRIELEEVTEVRPGAAPELVLSHRNVDSAELLVYPVDLMTLYLREKNLASIAAVNLSGIAPAQRRSIALEAREGMRSQTTEVELDLLQPGAYLAICRGGDLHASGLILVSALELDVEEDAASGLVRVQVLDGATDRFLRNVDVRVIGSASDDFVSGRTDPRGLFVADGIAGAATVIARHGERQYAFHRGAVALAKAGVQQQEDVPVQGAARYFDNVLRFNDEAQSARGQNWKTEVERDRKGVQVRQVK